MLAAGGLGVAVSLPLFSYLVAQSIPPVAANLAALLAAAAVTFVVNLRVVFRRRAVSVKSASGRFAVVVATTSLGDFAVIAALDRLVSADSWEWTAIKAGTILAGTAVRLVMYRRWAFAVTSPEDGPHDAPRLS